MDLALIVPTNITYVILVIPLKESLCAKSNTINGIYTVIKFIGGIPGNALLTSMLVAHVNFQLVNVINSNKVQATTNEKRIKICEHKVV